MKSLSSKKPGFFVTKDDGGAIMGGFVEELIEQGKQEGLKEGLQAGLQEGLQKGQQALRNAILDVLMLRFDAAPPTVSGRLEKINDLETLRQLNREAVTAESLAAFEQFLNTL